MLAADALSICIYSLKGFKAGPRGFRAAARLRYIQQPPPDAAAKRPTERASDRARVGLCGAVVPVYPARAAERPVRSRLGEIDRLVAFIAPREAAERARIRVG